jgi:hypothetical protein
MMSKGKFSQIAGLGKLNQYTREELIDHLVDYTIQVKKISEDEEVLLLTGENVRYEILYDLAGNFKQILREEWVDLNQVFDYRGK